MKTRIQHIKNLWDRNAAVLRKKIITLEVSIRKKKVSGQEPKFPSHEPRTRRASHSKEVIKMRAEINEGQKARQYRKSIHEDSFQQTY